MESGRQGGSETSSEENDRTFKEDMATTANKRSYECNFCKRGFTNAQALGGHMNIHRKDRAKGNQTTGTSRKVYEDYINPSFFIPPVSGNHLQPLNHYSVMESNRRSDDMDFQSSGSKPRQPYGYSNHRGPSPRSSMDVNDEELWGANLSLRIGSNLRVQDDHNKEDELDLELRLGHDP